MHPDLIALAVPFFMVAMGIEVLAGRVLRRPLYRLGSAIADIDTGIASQVADVFLRGVGLSVYAAAYRHRALDFSEGSVAPWVIGLVGVDFLFYWWHRASHVTNLLWAVHAVHHQSEDMNLAVALRQPALEALTIIPFHLPLALAGVPPWIYVSCYAVDLLYQFGLHTELAPRYGALEWVLNAPSAHRVHHGINPRYLDRNYGGILLVWDRLFGTYEPEGERPVYGVTRPLRSFSPIWANLAPLADLVTSVRRAPPGVKLAVLIGHPGRALATPGPSAPPGSRCETPLGARTAGYVLVHFVLLLASAGLFISLAGRVRSVVLAPAGILLLATSAALAAWTEGRSWALSLDLARQVGIVLALSAGVALSAGPRASAGAGLLSSTLLALLFFAFAPGRAEPRGVRSGAGPSQPPTGT